MIDWNNVKFVNIREEEVKYKEGYKVEFRPGVYVLVQNSKGEILFIFDNKSKGWELPGGGVELNEFLVDAAVREVKEESGYDVEVEEQPFYIHENFGYYHITDRFVHGLYYFYVGKLISDVQGEQNFDDGELILDVKWFKIEDIDFEFVHFQKKALNYFLENLKKLN